MGITGVGAGELIAEGTLAVEMGARVSDLGMNIHPHPALSETLMEAADVYFSHCAHYRPVGNSQIVAHIDEIQRINGRVRPTKFHRMELHVS